MPTTEKCKTGFVPKTFDLNNFQPLKNTYASKFINKDTNTVTLCVKPCDDGIIPTAPYTNIDSANKPNNPLDYESRSLGYTCMSSPETTYNSDKLSKIMKNAEEVASSAKCNKGSLVADHSTKLNMGLSCVYDATVYLAKDSNQH